jgi:hypothetical protein
MLSDGAEILTSAHVLGIYSYIRLLEQAKAAEETATIVFSEHKSSP